MITRWDVCWASVKFEDSDQYKRRPVLILNAKDTNALTMKMTHINHSSPTDYELQDWIFVGLNEPTFVRLDKKIRFDDMSKLIKIGKLSKQDIDGIKQKCKGLNISLIERFQEKDKMKLLKEEMVSKYTLKKICQFIEDSYSADDYVSLMWQLLDYTGEFIDWTWDYADNGDEYLNLRLGDFTTMDIVKAAGLGKVHSADDQFIKINADGYIETAPSEVVKRDLAYKLPSIVKYITENDLWLKEEFPYNKQIMKIIENM